MYSSFGLTSESLFILGRHEMKCWHKKERCQGIDETRDETVIGKYYRPLQPLECGPGIVVCQRSGSPSPSVETLKFLEEDDEGVLERVPIFVFEFSDILLHVAENGSL